MLIGQHLSKIKDRPSREIKEVKSPEDFVRAYFYDAFKSKILTGVPVLVTLAQGALESGWGKYAKGNNFFGVKAFKSWKGKKQSLKTHEYIKGKRVKVDAWFRVYKTPAASFTDHGKVIKKNWPHAFLYTDPLDFIIALQSNGKKNYATDIKYVEKMGKIIRRIKQLILEIENINI